MYITAYKTQLVLLLSSTFFLCQCTALTSPVTAKETLPSSIEETKADVKAPSAINGLVQDEPWQQDGASLTQADELTAKQSDEKQLLFADIERQKGRFKNVLSHLASIKEPNRLSNSHQAQYHELLALSYEAEGKTINGLSERLKLDPLLLDEQRKTNNQRALWLTLTNIPRAQLAAITLENKDSLLQGWLELQLISRQNRTQPTSLLSALHQWQTQYNDHPANKLLPNPLDSIAKKMIAQPKQIALLLPLSGALSGPGQAIQEGIMAAHKATPTTTAIEIKTYDTNQGEINDLYQKAISNGADFVIGPLTKKEVAILAGTAHPVPTLLLNDTDTTLQENAYSFGLSPINEATQVAIKAAEKGYNRALVIAPKNEWGQEITKAFSHQWSEQEGQVVDTLSYSPQDDINHRISDLLQITNSENRQRQLKQVAGEHIQTVMSHRQDFDVIFLVAYPSMARQIMPLLNYYNAHDVAIFATSSVYSGSANALKDKDLDGILFCDIPWVFSHQMGTKNWPEQFNSYNRLYALGRDSFALASQLNQLMLFPADGSMETNGTLFLKPSQQVARVLEWGQFKQGLAHSLGHLS